jgi:hypothetical protein
MAEIPQGELIPDISSRRTVLLISPQCPPPRTEQIPPQEQMPEVQIEREFFANLAPERTSLSTFVKGNTYPLSHLWFFCSLEEEQTTNFVVIKIQLSPLPEYYNVKYLMKKTILMDEQYSIPPPPPWLPFPLSPLHSFCI